MSEKDFLDKVWIAEKVVSIYLDYIGDVEKEKLYKMLEIFDFSSDEIEKIIDELVSRGRLKKRRDGKYFWNKYRSHGFSKAGRSNFKWPRIEKYQSSSQSFNPYYHPAIDRDFRSYLKAKKKWGNAADYIA